MRASIVFSGIAAAMLAVGAAAGEETEYTVDEVAPLSTQGRATLEARAGPVTFGEVLLQGMPSEGDPGRDPSPVVVVSNQGSSTAKLTITVSLEDDEGNVYSMGTRAARLDEGASNETFAVFDSGHLKPFVPHRQLSPGDWPKVTVVHLVARVVTKG
jgi:hypothetical protein